MDLFSIVERLLPGAEQWTEDELADVRSFLQNKGETPEPVAAPEVAVTHADDPPPEDALATHTQDGEAETTQATHSGEVDFTEPTPPPEATPAQPVATDLPSEPVPVTEVTTTTTNNPQVPESVVVGGVPVAVAPPAPPLPDLTTAGAPIAPTEGDPNAGLPEGHPEPEAREENPQPPVASESTSETTG